MRFVALFALLEVFSVSLCSQLKQLRVNHNLEKWAADRVGVRIGDVERIHRRLHVIENTLELSLDPEPSSESLSDVITPSIFHPMSYD